MLQKRYNVLHMRLLNNKIVFSFSHCCVIPSYSTLLELYFKILALMTVVLSQVHHKLLFLVSIYCWMDICVAYALVINMLYE